jgi:glutaredoxin
MFRILVFTQSGCLSCELVRVYLEARGIGFEERDVTADLEARRTMIELYESNETPTLVLFSGEEHEVINGFDPALLDQLLDPAPSSDAVSGN